MNGAEDNTFSIIHSPGFLENETTRIQLESNGGILELTVVFKNGEIQGIAEQNLEELVVYPNPAGEMLFLKTRGNTLMEEISVINMAGKSLIYKKLFSTENGIDISELKNGLYIVKIKINNRILTNKLVIKH